MRFIVICPQGLGDALEATPFVRALKLSADSASVCVVVLRSGPYELFASLPNYVDEVLYLPYWEKGIAAFLRGCAAVPFGGVAEALFVMYPAARWHYHLLARLFRAKIRVAHRYWDPSFQNLLWVYDKLVPVEREHNIVRNLDLLPAAGIRGERSTSYVVPDTWRGSRKQRNRVVLHVGTIAHSGLEQRRWPVKHFAELGRRLLARGYEVVILSGPSERREASLVNESVVGSSLFEGTLAEVARFLGESAALVANDSGIAHLAAAVGAPVLALFGPTPVEHGPLGPNAVSFRPSPCPPCFDPRLLNTSCALNIDFRCLKRDLSIDIADARLQDLLQSTNAAPIG